MNDDLVYLKVSLFQYRLSSINLCRDGLCFEARTNVLFSKSHSKNENFMTYITNGHIFIN